MSPVSPLVKTSMLFSLRPMAVPYWTKTWFTRLNQPICPQIAGRGRKEESESQRGTITGIEGGHDLLVTLFTFIECYLPSPVPFPSFLPSTASSISQLFTVQRAGQYPAKTRNMDHGTWDECECECGAHLNPEPGGIIQVIMSLTRASFR